MITLNQIVLADTFITVSMVDVNNKEVSKVYSGRRFSGLETESNYNIWQNKSIKIASQSSLKSIKVNIAPGKINLSWIKIEEAVDSQTQEKPQTPVNIPEESTTGAYSWTSYQAPLPVTSVQNGRLVRQVQGCSNMNNHLRPENFLSGVGFSEVRKNGATLKFFERCGALTRSNENTMVFGNLPDNSYLIYVRSEGNGPHNDRNCSSGSEFMQIGERGPEITVSHSMFLGSRGGKDKYIAIYKIMDSKLPIEVTSNFLGDAQIHFMTSNRNLWVKDGRTVDPKASGNRIVPSAAPDEIILHADDEGGIRADR